MMCLIGGDTIYMIYLAIPALYRSEQFRKNCGHSKSSKTTLLNDHILLPIATIWLSCSF